MAIFGYPLYIVHALMIIRAMENETGELELPQPQLPQGAKLQSAEHTHRNGEAAARVQLPILLAAERGKTLRAVETSEEASGEWTIK